jgi:hypothetical protein
MHLTSHNSQFVIYDDVLPAPEFQRFWQMFSNASFQSVHARGVSGYYRPTDGNPFIGPSIAWTHADPASLLPDGVRVEALPVRFHPTGEPYDAVFEVLDRVLAEHPDLVGVKGVDWVGALTRLQAYPVGSSIAWHTDDTDVTGSFIFYAHPAWDVHWGGELFIADAATRHGLTRQVATHAFDSRFDTEVLMRTGVGHYVMPRPNRLVVLGEGNPHKVEKVAPAAGNHVRGSFSGFFMRPEGVTKQVQSLMKSPS